MKCNAMDKTFSKFEKCRVKAESRDLQYFQVYIKYYQLPIKEVQTRFYFLKRANGYKPFLYDFTLKCCFTKHLNSVTSIVWRWFTTVSNLNHSCPLTLTQLKCIETDKSYIKFNSCRVKAESRDLQYFTIYIKFLQLPITDMRVHFRFLKRANGYKPFLYDFSFNCDFIKNLNQVTRIIWGWIKHVSNLNHSCPLIEDFEIKRLENRYLQEQLGALPIINGDYAFYVDFYSNNISRFNVKFYGTIF
ncbi:hypothetical protein CVS40_5442 [Lucilia cuprina]|nr:hypothetical protein CVS40_5442 [Lucilia cuprina]